MFQRLLTTFVTCLFLFASLSTIGPKPEIGARASNCDPASQRNISLSVLDKEGRSVNTLLPEDLTISEGKTTRDILKLEGKTNAPLSVAILIDTSFSQERTLPRTKLAAQKFVELILRSNKDRVALVTFTGEATVEQDLTTDLSNLRAAIERVKFVPPRSPLLGSVVLGPTPPSRDQVLNGATAIWDAIWATVDGIPAAAGSRAVIVLLTDGEDTISKTKRRDAIEHAAARDVAVFSIGVADSDYVDLNRDNLKKLAEETGGRAFFPKKLTDLDAVFIETAQALQSQYLLSYCSANQKPSVKPLRLEIEIKNPQLRQSNLRLSYPHYGL